MTTNKDFKRVVRTRMRKTGESYTAARRALLAKPTSGPPRAPGTTGDAAMPPATAPVASPVASPVVAPVASALAPADFARAAGIRDEVVKARTGCSWEKWVGALDFVKAHSWSHAEIARHLLERYRLPGWWAQTVTVGYERIRGLRAKGQRRSGSYDVNKSRTFAVSQATLYRAVRDVRRRGRWLGVDGAVVRSATPHKVVRLAWPDGTAVVCQCVDRGPDKATLTVQHLRLPSREHATEVRQAWGRRLGTLGDVLAPRPRA